MTAPYWMAGEGQSRASGMVYCVEHTVHYCYPRRYSLIRSTARRIRALLLPFPHVVYLDVMQQ